MPLARRLDRGQDEGGEILVAGKKQHYIPRAVLRGFLIPDARTPQVWVFRRDRAFRSAIDDAASSNYFYSELSADGAETLDDVMTRHENGQLNDDLNILGAAPAGPVDTEVAARVLSHLTIRGGHVRGVFRSAASMLAAAVEGLFGSPEAISALVGADGPLPGDRFRDRLREALPDDHPVMALGVPREVMENVGFMLLRENASDGFSEMVEGVAGVADRFRTEGPQIARDAHRRGLARSLIPEERTSILERYAWRIDEVDGGMFVLPDFVAMAVVPGGRIGSLFDFDADEVGRVLMPLTPSRMLVGEAGDSAPVPHGFNELAARHSLDFFVSAYRNDGLDALRERIGSTSLDSVAGGIDEAVSEFRKEQSVAERVPNRTAAAPQDFTIDFTTDLLDEAGAARIVATVRTAFGQLGGRFDLTPLARVEAPRDFRAALAHYGFEQLGDAEDGAYWPAANLPFEDGGARRTALILHPETVAMLLGDDEDRLLVGMGVLVVQLAAVGVNAGMQAIPPEEWGILRRDRSLLPCAKQALRDFHTAGLHARFEIEVVQLNRAALVRLLAGLADGLAEIRRAYWRDRDLDALVNGALEMAASILSAAAAAAGANRAVPSERPVEFLDELEDLGLRRWFELFERDLAGAWPEDAARPGAEGLIALGRHIERLLLVGGIVFWDDGSDFGQVRVFAAPDDEVPTSSDTVLPR